MATTRSPSARATTSWWRSGLISTMGGPRMPLPDPALRRRSGYDTGSADFGKKPMPVEFGLTATT
ncbi:MAG: hypothetical protein R3F11_18850 [Verrucomicrobiales bacterium]